MRILQIKQAECALADGRLDEAFELASGSDLRAHRRGQKLIGRLVRAFVDRARDHLAAGRARQALADCEKAEKLGGNLPETAELRRRITRSLAGEQDSRRQRADLVAAAGRHVEDGRLSLAEQMLAGVNGGSRPVDMLRYEAAARRAAVEAALGRADAAARRQDWFAAIEELRTARTNQAPNARLADLTAEVVSGAVARAHQHILGGRVDLADGLLRCLKPLAGPDPEVHGLSRFVEESRRAWRWIQRGRTDRAREVLQRIRAMQPDAKWLKEAVGNADDAAKAMESLRAGPLAMLDPGEAPSETEHAGERSGDLSGTSAGPGPAAAETGPAESALPSRLQLQVDEAGAFLVLRPSRVTVGPISSPHLPDLGLMADPNLPVVEIERVEGDYLLRTATPVCVNDKTVTGKLLADGDRIALSPRCRLRFRLPNAASSTAVLELSGTRLPQGDARRVILLDREIILGPDDSAHVRVALSAQAVLHVKDGRLVCRTDLPLTVDRRPADPSRGIPLGVPVRIGPIGLVLTEA